MHIERSVNLIAAWALAAGDEMRAAAEGVTGMSGGAPAAIVAVAAEPGMTIDTLRRALHLTHPGTVRLVDRLVERGWLSRDPGPGRAVALRLTEAGVLTHDRLLTARERAVTALLDALPAAKIDQLAELLTPMLVERAGDLRRLCRLCDRAACEPCPPWTRLRDQNMVDG